ncbi:MAG: hypothetical protein J5379_08370 [Clostridiales bacterium]|nr:hypothetical protein [Clostridiales bacterium]
MSESKGPSVPASKRSGSVSSERSKNQRTLLILMIVECVVLVVMSVFAFLCVHEVCHYDSYYRLYYFYAITGILMAILLVIAYFRKWLAIQLLSIIVFLLWVTYCGATIFSCKTMVRTKKLEEPYVNSEMYVVFQGKLYTWEGKTIVYGLPAEWEDLQKRETITVRDDSKLPTEELHSKGINEGCMIFYQDDYKYILVEVVTGSLFEFIDPDDPPTETISTATTTLGIGI